ncbi:MAG TPA: HAD hydrolase-like protein, partial [Candidatus Saccharimonadales bacterium]|nr:HAD hydrolase-like protein [Candidatus Saccharimonadales bacterium]
MGKYQYVLLDWDGNLAKTLDVWLEAVRIPLAKRGFNLSDIEIAECFGAVRTGFEELGVTDIDEAITEMDELAEKMLPNVDLYPDALYVLEELKAADKQTALITTSWRKNVLRLLDKYDIR